MLSLFRRGGIAQVFLAGIVVTIILVFVLEFRSGRGAATVSSADCAVEVFDYCVQSKEYHAAYGLVSLPGLEAKQARRLKLQEHVIEGLVERELLVRAAALYELGASDQALDEQLILGHALVSLPASEASFLTYYLLLCRHDPSGRCEPGGPQMMRKLRVEDPVTKQFDPRAYERDLRYRTNRSPKEFREMQRRELLAARMRELVRERVQVSEAEAFQLFERERSRATVRTAQLDRRWFARFAVEVKEAELQAWAEAQKSRVSEGVKALGDEIKEGCPLVSEILVELPPGASDSEKTLARERAQLAKDRLSRREDFAAVARDASDASSAALGGKLGCLGAGYGPGAEALLEAAKALKPNEVSGVVETERGFHLLKLHGLLAPADVESTKRELVSARLYVEEEANRLLLRFADEAIGSVKQGQPLADVVTALSRRYARLGDSQKPAPALDSPHRPKVEISAPFSQLDQPLPNAAPREAVAKRAFELTEPDEILATPIHTADGLALLQLKEKEPATKEAFEADKARVLTSLRELRENEALARYVAELRKKAEKRISINPAFLPKAEQDPANSSPLEPG